MSPTTYQILLENGHDSSEWPKWQAVATRERFAAFVSFRWYQPGLPPSQNVISAPHSLTSACHFGGNNAISAANAVTVTTFATYGAIYTGC